MKLKQSLLLTAAAIAFSLPMTVIGGDKNMAGPKNSFNEIAQKVGAISQVGFVMTENSIDKYTAARTGMNAEGILNMTGKVFDEFEGNRLSGAVSAAVQTNQAHAIGTGNRATAKAAENTIEYGVLVQPDGSSLMIAREDMGDRPLSSQQLHRKNAELAQYGLPPLENGAAGYHTIYAAQIDTKGCYTEMANPFVADLSKFGVKDAQFGHLPRDPVAVPQAAPQKVRSPALGS